MSKAMTPALSVMNWTSFVVLRMASGIGQPFSLSTTSILNGFGGSAARAGARMSAASAIARMAGMRGWSCWGKWQWPAAWRQR